VGALEYRHRPQRHQRGRQLHLFHSVLRSTRLYSFENQWTTYQNGVDMHFDWGASQFLTKQFQVGLVCYVYKEIGCDSGSAEASDQSARPTVQILWQRSFPGAPSHSARLFER
jgi:Putative MetA-pathway of phenol degradation